MDNWLIFCQAQTIICIMMSWKEVCKLRPTCKEDGRVPADSACAKVGQTVKTNVEGGKTNFYEIVDSHLYITIAMCYNHLPL